MDDTVRRAPPPGALESIDAPPRERTGPRRRPGRARVPRGALDLLLRTELLPRLGLLHGEAASEPPPIPPPTFRDVEAFALALLRDGVDAALARFETLMVRGYATDALLDGLLAPAARLMGVYWEADDCDFLAVDIGVSRLVRFVRIVRPSADPVDARPGHEVILAASPGECHTFGSWLVGESLLASGWHVRCPQENTRQALLDMAVEAPSALIGLSLSCESGLDDLTQTIRALRRATPGHPRAIMVGGRMFHDDPERVVRVGADGAADDAPSAVQLAERLLLHLRR